MKKFELSRKTVSHMPTAMLEQLERCKSDAVRRILLGQGKPRKRR